MKLDFLRRIGAMLLAATMILSLVPATALAESGVEFPAPSTQQVGTENTDGIDNSTQQVFVSNSDALEEALSAGDTKICITADFELDRTFFITNNVTIYSAEAHTLIRKSEFAGDVFVVGESADGVVCEEKVTLTIGTKDATDSDILKINGNDNAMTVDVTGSIFFVCATGQVDIYSDVTITNCVKKGNQRALNTEKYALCNDRTIIGGAVGIIVTGGSMNIYGGNYSYNGVTKSGLYGGAFFNHGTLNVYDGVFEYNYALRAGVFYNYRTMNIHKATIANNEARANGSTGSLGGAIYLPSSTGAILNVGGSQKAEATQVVFRNNTADTAGAIYSSGKVVLRNTLFDSNTATEMGGAIYGGGKYNNITAYDCEFVNNEAADGGALFVANQRSGANVEVHIRDSVFSENVATNGSGGAVHLANNARSYFRDVEFNNNSANRGGAIHVTEASLEVNYVTFNQNTSTGSGGAIYLDDNSTAVLNQITATKNDSNSGGGFIYSNAAELKMYNSTIFENTAANGSAIRFDKSAVADIYNCTFKDNVCDDSNSSNAGALFFNTNGTKVTLNRCRLEGNQSSGLGGAILITGKSLLDLFDITAVKNSASKGGFMYETTLGTIVTISGLTVSENSATVGGPIIWGNTTNAKLYINKSNYTDSDVTTELDDTYWASAIVNKLTVEESNLQIPTHDEYDQPEFDTKGSPNVKTAKQLADAIHSGIENICILNSFEIDRTFYVSTNTTIYSNSPVTLTRAKDFAGDIFVVGESSDGTPCEEKVVLTIGTPNTDKNDFIVFDGNSSVMETTVNGSVFFLCKKAQVDLHPDVSVINCTKQGNVRALEDRHVLSSYSKYVGGAVGIIAEGASMNIYGGNYSNNASNITGNSIYGGAFFNYGTMKVYGGTFKNNTSYRAGTFYNYRTLYLYSATIEDNQASVGGAIYLPASTGAFLYIGTDNAEIKSEVVFKGNHATSGGGAIYSAGRMTMQDTTFESNTTDTTGGAIYASGKYKTITAKNTSFTNNSAIENGSAIYLSGDSDYAEKYVLKVENVTFSGNTATGNGAIYLSGTGANIISSSFTNNSAANGAAIYITSGLMNLDGVTLSNNNASTNGGALAVYGDASVEMNNITANENTAVSNGGFAIFGSSNVKIYNSKFNNNQAMDAGAIFITESCVAKIYASEFKQNIAQNGNGGALVINSNADALIHSCAFIENLATNYGGAMYISGGAIAKLYNITATKNSAMQGGFLFETDSNTQVTLVGIAVSGNTATNGGAIIWGDNIDAILNINKSIYTDTDVSTTLDNNYWTSALANLLTVNEVSDEIPNYADYGNEEPDGMWNAKDVTTAEELQNAINAGEKEIRITKSFALDRTFYITTDTTIFSTSPITLTRDPNFGGDIFVIGQSQDGTPCEVRVSLNVGIPSSKTKNLLVLDGNKNAMNVTVTGTVFFICSKGNANLYENLTVKNFKKNGNERTLETVHGVSYPEYVGGAVGILAKSATINIYGGTYSQNAANESGKSTYGGAFYNFGTMNIYGGTFTGNRAYRAGAFYNYRVLNIYNAQIEENYASTYGGAIYMPASTGAYLYVGKEHNGVAGNVSFVSNSAKNNGGAIYGNNVIQIENATFKSNKAVSGGAIVSYSAILSVANSSFTSNTASSSGGAISVSGKNTSEKSKELTLTNTTFTSNSSDDSGAIYLNEETRADISGCTFEKNNAKANTKETRHGGGALYANNATVEFVDTTFKSNTTLYNGGAIAVYSNSKITFTNVIADANTAENNGGFLYACESLVYIYDCEIKNGVAKNNGGAISLENVSETTVARSIFENNKATGSGGAIYVNSNDDKSLFHSCTFIANTGAKGGAILVEGNGVAEIYNTTAKNNTATYGGILYLGDGAINASVNGLTVSGNTAATEGGLIYSNSSDITLNINKSNVTDEDVSTTLDETYWANAIAGFGEVKENVDRIPGYNEVDNESFGYLWPAVDVADANALESALAQGEKHIRVVADFKLDRTFTINSDTVLFSTKPHKLTRDENFDGVIFNVVSGQDGKETVFVIGNSSSTTENLLTIDGNGANMTVPVIGAIINASVGAKVEIFCNLTLTGCTYAPLNVDGSLIIKGGNFTSNTSQMDGALIVCNGSVEIHGGTFTGNTTTTNGGVILNNGNTEIIGGTFNSNKAVNGGVVYNNGILKISGGTFSSNSSTEGGVVCNINSLEVTGGTFTSNKATANGGAISNQATLNILGGTFNKNKATSNGGAVVSTSDVGVNGAEFISNSADLGGAIYVVAQNQGEAKIIVDNTIFKENSAKKGGAISADRANLIITAEFDTNHAENGGAIYLGSECDATLTNINASGDNADNNGGFIYVTGAGLSISNSQFTKTISSYFGGAIYATKASVLNITSSTFTQTSSIENGGAIYLDGDGVTAEVNKCTFTKCSAVENGGAIFKNDKGELLVKGCKFEGCNATNGGAIYAKFGMSTITNNNFIKNKASQNGGAIVLSDDSSCECNNNTFEKNTAGANGGALCIENDMNKTILQKLTFTENSGGYGGAIYTGGFSKVEIFDITATKNVAIYGAVLYIASVSNDITINGMTVSANTARRNGYIICANAENAVLRINKDNYVDKDKNGKLRDDYWKVAIIGSVTISSTNATAPSFGQGAVNVSSAAQLENAIKKNRKLIRITADFEIDRTFFITSDVTIFSDTAHTLKRAANFSGDFFVIGETADGKRAFISSSVIKLTLGNPSSEVQNLLIIDGNKDNMQTTVKGSIFFLSYGGKVDLYDNVTIKNCYKQDNERSYGAGYKLSRPNRIGGAVAIIANGVLTIYGGNYKNNLVNEENSSTEEGRNSSIGGVFYNNGNLIIRGGNFEENEGARGAIVYNYRNVKIIAGTFSNNYATKHSAIYYAPSSTVAQLIVGSTEAGAEKVLIKNNTSRLSAGVIYSSHFSAVVVLGNTSFKNNASKTDVGGAIYVVGALTVKNAEFVGNKSAKNGGAIYNSRGNNDEITRLTIVEGCTFEENQAKYGGAIATHSSAASSYNKGSILSVSDCLFQGNIATNSGGAFYSDALSELEVNNSSFIKNKSNGEAGAMYITGKAKVKLNENIFDDNEATSSGGAFSIRSAWVDIVGGEISNNTSKKNGGAMYIAYSSSIDINSHVTINNVNIQQNSASNGGAIYITRRDIEVNSILLNVKNSTFQKNSCTGNGGAILFTAGVKSYFDNVTFKENSAKSNGGAIQAGGNSLFEGNKCTFTGNTGASGGAVSVTGGATVLMNHATATKNSSTSYAGFLYNEGGILKLYDSAISQNYSYSGGAMYLYTNAVSSIYNTNFTNNYTFLSKSGSTGNGGALFIYTGSVDTLIHSCTFTNNQTTGCGGAAYISGPSLVKMYNTTATKNSATKGGFLYVTKAGTVVDVIGLTVSANTSQSGGNIIWGNTANAKLNIDKKKYTDNQTTTLNDSYWSSAIEGTLTVTNVNSQIAGYDPYNEKVDEDKPQTTKKPVSVEDVFTLAQKSSDADINKYYNKLAKLDNSSNFMSRGTKDYPNINGKTVTVDTFVYSTNGKADNGIVGLGIMLYQSLLYKKENPDKEVYIDIASYRFSVQAGVNINRNSRYFGYERDLVGKNYDEYGFVRISYLLITAAKMGIHVNVIGQLDGYPIDKSNANFYDYFTQQLNDPCDPNYAKGKVIGDYLDFNFCYWTLDAKGGTDMMHTKMCTVSDYLDMNGVAHKNAVWSSSSNLDGVKSDGRNANWKQQTATIITNHDDIYRVATNYLRLISSLCYQEGIIEFQDYMNNTSTEQIDLILQGRGNEIPADKQIVYVGTPKDDVFELYFTPFGGGRLSWDEVHNPYCKYLREMYESEDYILFTWNAAEYSGKFTLAQQMEEMIIKSFHENKNVKNKIFTHMESFDATTFDDLIVGVDIGYKSFMERPYGKIHNKDIQLSYVKDGQRYFVSLLNSLNLHSGSMYYQSNFMLVVKETSCDENGVFSTVARYTTTGDIAAHEYGDVETKNATATKHGYTYRKCLHCDDTIIVDEIVHNAGEWVVDKEATQTTNGVRHRNCTVCGDLMESQEILRTGVSMNLSNLAAKKFTSTSSISLSAKSVPLTIEARISIPKSENGRTGVILGNYSENGTSIINLEGAENGKIKLYIKNGSKVFKHTFSKDVRSNDPVDIAVTFASGSATLYVNGKAVESVKMTVTLPTKISNLKLGGDNRSGNSQYFKGGIYFVNLFSKVRTATEIEKDRLFVSSSASNLVYSKYFTNEDVSAESFTTQLGSMTFKASTVNRLDSALSAAPKTIEARISLSKDVTGRGGVIFGNYGESFSSPLNLEVYTNGRLRLYFKSGGKTITHIFKTDIRTQSGSVHIAVTLSGKTATLYVDGVKKETATLKAAVPSATKQFCIGGDNRSGNTQYFKGKIYSVNVFSDVRTASEIKSDAIAVPSNASKLIYSSYVTNNSSQKVTLKAQTFSSSVRYELPTKLESAPKTIEATIMLPTSVSGRGGVIFGNYSESSSSPLNLEVYTGGKLRLYFKSGGKTITHTFKTDIRNSTNAVHIAVTLSGKTATLYVDGVKKETATLKAAVPSATSQFCIGGDNRSGNTQYFKGKIYSVNVFSDIRTASEIKKDAAVVTNSANSLLFSGYFYDGQCNVTATSKDHTASSWKTAYAATTTECGVRYKECVTCKKVLNVKEIPVENSNLNSVDYTSYSGKNFKSTKEDIQVTKSVSGNNFTIETLIQVTPDTSGRAGTLIGNYVGDDSDQFNIEIYEDGKVRLYYKVDGKTYTHLFSADVRANKKTHVALTVSGNNVTLYINGKLSETHTATVALPSSIGNLKIGGDYRSNGNYFSGQMYSMYIFSKARSADQIALDAAIVLPSSNTVYSQLY